MQILPPLDAGTLHESQKPLPLREVDQALIVAPSIPQQTCLEGRPASFFKLGPRTGGRTKRRQQHPQAALGRHMPNLPASEGRRDSFFAALSSGHAPLMGFEPSILGCLFGSNRQVRAFSNAVHAASNASKSKPSLRAGSRTSFSVSNSL